MRERRPLFRTCLPYARNTDRAVYAVVRDRARHRLVRAPNRGGLHRKEDHTPGIQSDFEAA